ncbi:hypothetical protein [Sorangium sp. So ce341]|uniref:hypothetical protein n=1 Tax=Sorangium sp. So ce341 TaxID=3133302 RepID=UPI003F60EBCC
MKKMNCAAFALIFIGLPGCAGLQVQRGVHCDSGDAYRKGYHDAHEGRPEDTELAHGCFPEQRASVDIAYANGYADATAARDRAARRAPSPRVLVVVPPGTAVISAGDAPGEVAVEKGSGDCFFGDFMTLRNHSRTRAIVATVLRREMEIARPIKESIVQISLPPGGQRDLGCSKPHPTSPESSWQVTGARYTY